MNKNIGLLLLCALSLNAADIYATFNVKPLKEATLAFTSGGTVSSLNVDIGSHVKKGEVLATLDNEEQVQMLNLAKTDEMNANIQAKQNQNSYNRFKAVEDIMDDEKFEKIDFSKQVAEINVIKAKNSVALRKAQLEKRTLVAPFSGVITAKYKEIGDAVSGAQPEALLHLMDTSSVKLVVEFDGKYFTDVKVGDEFLYFVDGVNGEQRGKISKIYPTVNSKTRKISAEVVTKNLMPGLFGHGTIKAK